MQKKLLLLKLVLLLFAYVNVNAQDYRPRVSISAKQARVLATEQLPTVLQWIELEDLSLYGFSGTDDFSKITVGRPIYLSTIEEIKQIVDVGKTDLPITSMMLPLILDNSVRCFIYVSYENGKWAAVGLGSREYAIKGADIFNKSDDNASLMVSILQMSEEFIADNSTRVVTRYKPLLNLGRQLEKESYTLKELMTFFDESVKKAKNTF